MICEYGMVEDVGIISIEGDDIILKSLSDVIANKIKEIIAEQMAKAQEEICENRDVADGLILELIKKKLNKEEIAAILSM